MDDIKTYKTNQGATLADTHKKIRYFHSFGENDHPPQDPLPLISLFTGGGGLDLGLEWAGFETRAYVENNRHCINTLRLNRPNWPLVENGDITQITSEQIMKVADVQKGEVALVAGGAPCQPFSSLGKNEGENNENGQLYRHFIRVVKDLQPAMFIFENVRGMMQNQNHKKVIDFMNDEFAELGYGLETALLCAADYGVPQKRYRVFMIGRRDGIKPGFPLPTHARKPEVENERLRLIFEQNEMEYTYENMTPWVTVRSAFNAITREHYERPDSIRANLAPEIIRMIGHIARESKMNWKSLPEDVKFACWKNTKFQGSDNFSRLQWDEPSVTIRTGAIYPAKGKYIHPYKNRGLYTIELAALQSFPLDLDGDNKWYFSGGITNIARQIGNAVPPLLANAIGVALRQQISEVREYGG